MIRDNLPPFLAQIREMDDLLQAEEPEIACLDTEVAAWLREFHVETITEKSIALWEDFLGFDHPSLWSITRRRERIKARLTACAPMTPKLLQEVIQWVGGVQVEVEEDADIPMVWVRFVGRYGVPPYMQDIAREVEKLRPFHVPVEYIYQMAYLALYEGQTLESLGSYSLLGMAQGLPLEGEHE